MKRGVAWLKFRPILAETFKMSMFHSSEAEVAPMYPMFYKSRCQTIFGLAPFQLE